MRNKILFWVAGKVSGAISEGMNRHHTKANGKIWEKNKGQQWC